MKRIIVLSTIAALMLVSWRLGWYASNEDAGAKKCSEATLQGVSVRL